MRQSSPYVQDGFKMDPQTIVILTSNFPPTNIVGALRPYRLSKHLCALGWKVIVVTHFPLTGHDLDHSLLQDVTLEIRHVGSAPRRVRARSRFVAHAFDAGSDLLGKWVKPDAEIVHVIPFYRNVLEIVKHQTVDVILTTSPPHSIHIAGLMLKQKLNIPWVVDFRDPWDDYLEKGNCDLSNPFERFLESQIIQKADAVVVTTNTNLKVLQNKHPLQAADKFHVLTNTFDRNRTSKQVKRDDSHFTICYTGIFYPQKDPYGFFRALRNWFKSMTDTERTWYKSIMRICLIGSGDGVTRRVINDLELQDVVSFYSRMSHDEAVAMTLSADLVLISTGQAERTRPGWLPSKLFEYLGCRIPILALIREGEMADIIRRTNSGYVILAENHEEIQACLKKEMSRKFPMEVQSPERAQEFLFKDIEEFEEEAVMGKFATVISETCSPGRS